MYTNVRSRLWRGRGGFKISRLLAIYNGAVFYNEVKLDTLKIGFGKKISETLPPHSVFQGVFKNVSFF